VDGDGLCSWAGLGCCCYGRLFGNGFAEREGGSAMQDERKYQEEVYYRSILPVLDRLHLLANYNTACLIAEVIALERWRIRRWPSCSVPTNSIMGNHVSYEKCPYGLL
jgi:hypothetical protein